MGNTCAVSTPVIPESEDQGEYNSVASTAAENNNLVVGMGYQAIAAVKQMATANKDKTFAIMDFEFVPPISNVASVIFKEEEQGFLAGIIAGLYSASRSQKIAGM